MDVLYAWSDPPRVGQQETADDQRNHKQDIDES